MTSKNGSISKTSDAIIGANGSIKNLDSETIPEEIAIYYNEFKIKEYIVSVYMGIFTSWEPKLLMDVCILSQKCKDCNIIKRINEHSSYIIYFDPSKYSVKDRYDRDGYSLLYNNIATIALKD